ncbi:tRNA nucleotidyltransferase (CCA-adding enzyme) [Flavobacterium sp. HSC-32F16]|uniref:hypothetical protein n=1 Tax=Flavobacterium sp. HSC-32F16 TaxID=2910964 RepID=UPI0020A2A9B7|nr:hypothetical protein [Flavobacterium sp. HSC-32F16]MCP2026301.1 tRNA nucleotidyltransferase (CCA-adding enzyme) [Flavobacterium sp. HSC-32F16]
MVKKYFSIITTILLLSIIYSCKDSKTNDKESNTEVTELKEIPETEESAVVTKKSPEDFVPKGYVIFDTIYGDLNKDNLDDLAFIIKGTDKSKVIQDEYRGQLDRNRRGIIVLLNKNEGYELAVKNYDCFSSENEDGGVYFAPELGVEITKGKLFVNYGHGRYGYWAYTFRYQNSDLELIGYDASSNQGPMVLTETSINFLTKKKITNENINRDAEDENEVFEKTETKISKSKLIKLSEIKDFDELEVSE